MNTVVTVSPVAVLEALGEQTRQRGGSPSVQNIEDATKIVADLLAFRDRTTHFLAELTTAKILDPHSLDMAARASGLQALGVSLGKRVGAYG